MMHYYEVDLLLGDHSPGIIAHLDLLYSCTMPSIVPLKDWQ
jgi:hypothetical protein